MNSRNAHKSVSKWEEQNYKAQQKNNIKRVTILQNRIINSDRATLLAIPRLEIPIEETDADNQEKRVVCMETATQGSKEKEAN